MTADQPFDYKLPYPSQRQPVLARNCVATSQPLAAEAGLEMLRKGGNAIDAAVAAAMTLTVVEPTSNGIGSDAFALVWAGGGLHGLNASGRSPADLTPERFAGQDRIPYDGWGGVTVPGAVSAWVELSAKFGALPLETVAQPAITYAAEGFAASPMTAGSWYRSARGHYAKGDLFKAWRDTFAPKGRGPRPGEWVRLPDHARTLTEIAHTKGDSFYHGDLAAQIARASAEQGGLLTSDDLAAHAPEWVRPISIEYQDHILHEIPPNGQGLTALIALGIMQHFDLASLDPDSPECLHLQIEAMKLAFADARRYIADPGHMDIDPAELLKPEYLEKRAALITPDAAGNFDHGDPLIGGTVYLCTADAQGNMVSYIQSNYTGFGSGVVVPNTGIGLQNRGCCFTLEPGHPNEVGPSKKPYHTIIPGFVTRAAGSTDEVPVMAFGVMGGYMQPQGHAQVLSRLANHKQNPQAALDASRWQYDRGKRILIEPGFKETVYEALAALGHELRPSSSRNVTFGRGQIIYLLGNDDDTPINYLAATDLRADGQAIGF
ncbi:MAG: gamma-glutamyltransferase family protein [Planctomycetes bacterium]|nr:gamma-glutamyltransferase family protein [Planctomycetota bacterium]